MPEHPSAERARGGTPSVQSSSRWRDMWKPFWAIPVACTAAAVLVGGLFPMLDEWLGTTLPYFFQGGPDGARGLLGTIATGMITMTSLVFSITMVILQLASSQFTPRVLGGFLDSRITQVTLGVFTASFVYALTVTRYVRGEDGERSAFVPQISVTVSFVLVLASVGCFLAFIHHITASIQVSKVISRIGDQTLKLADKMYPNSALDGRVETGPTWSPAPETPRVAFATEKRHGRITYVDYDALVAFASKHDYVITIDRPVGYFLTEGQELLRIWGTEEVDDTSRDKLYSYIGLGAEREMWQDVAFGIRQLVDIAERALSSGVNDPTTAVQCIDELHRILHRLVQRDSPSPYIADDDGHVRVLHHPQSIDDHVRLATEEITFYSTDTLQVPHRLRAMLDDLAAVSSRRYMPAIEAARERVDESAASEAAR